MAYVTSNGVQQFSITIASGYTTGTATINSVGSGAFILYGGLNPSVSNNPGEDFAYLTLTNSTTITATRNTSTGGSVVINGCIVDGTSNLINSVQYGTITISSGSASGTATISAVTNNNAAVHLLGWKSANTSFSGINEESVLSLSGTTVTAARPSTSGALVVGFVVIEFKGTALNQNVQNVALTSSSNVTSYSGTISSVNVNNAIVIWAGSNIATSTTDLAQIKQRGALASSTSVTASVNTAVANAKKFNAAVVEFKSGVLNSNVQRGTITLTGVTSNTSTLSNVTFANTALNWVGNTTTATTAVLDIAEGAAALSSASGSSLINFSGALNSANPLTIVITSSTAGNLLAVCVSTENDAGAVIGVTDDQGQTWIQVPGAAGVHTASQYTSDIWYFPNTVAGVSTVTVTTANSGAGIGIWGMVYEISNIAHTSPIDTAGNVSNSAASTTITTAPLTTTNAGSVILTVVAEGNNGVNSVASPYTLDTYFGFSAYYFPTGTVTSQSAVFSQESATSCSSSAAFISTGVSGQIVMVTKFTATAKITASWEVVEFSTLATYSASFSPSASLSATGASLFKSHATSAASVTLTGHAKTLSASKAFVSATASFSPTGHALASSFSSMLATASLLPSGITALRSVATFSPNADLIADGNTEGHIASFIALAAFLATGAAKSSGVSSFPASAAFSAIGKSLDISHATFLPYSTLSPHGKAHVDSAATILALSSFLAKGRSFNAQTAIFGPSSIFSAHGQASINGTAFFSPGAMFYAVGQAIQSTHGTFTAQAVLLATGRAFTSSSATFNAIATFSPEGVTIIPTPSNRVLIAGFNNRNLQAFGSLRVFYPAASKRIL